MFGQSTWKRDIEGTINGLEQQLTDLHRSITELKAQNHLLSRNLKSVTRKLVTRLPISLESLEKGLTYDLIFPEELEPWLQTAKNGIIIDLRNSEDYIKESIPGSLNFPFEQLTARAENIDVNQPILLVCDNGIKSVTACEALADKGFFYLYVLKGGMSFYKGDKVSQMEVSTDNQPVFN